MSKLCDAGATWSRGKWWLWAILGLLALYLLMLFFKWDPIEKDIQSRTNAALASAGQGWALADLDMRGRDVMLTGLAPSEAAKQQAIDTARSVYGVRVVDTDFGLKQYRNPSLSMLEAGPGAVLKGELASQAEIDQAVAAAEGLYGAGNVDNQLTLSNDVAAAGWLGGLGSALKSAQSANDGQLSISESGAAIAGMVRSEDDKSSVFNLVKAALNESLGDNIENNLVVKPYTPSTVGVERVGDGIILRGVVQRQETVNQFVDAASGLVGASNVDNQLKVSADSGAVEWGQGIAGVMSALPSPGAVSVANGQFRVVGEVASDAAKASVLDSASSLFSGLGLIDDVTVTPPPPPPPTPAVVSKPEPKPVVTALQICQGRLNETMEGKKIEFATNSADISYQSFPLLASIIRVLSDCESYLSATKLIVSGHTDDKGSDAYNQNLSAERAGSVVRYLTEAGVSSSMLEAKGYGETQPIASNETPAGRAKNRRIQFDIQQ